ncbi:hypothetical protein Droror1_Dr00005264 [Drosera rotundifolia]
MMAMHVFNSHEMGSQQYQGVISDVRKLHHHHPLRPPLPLLLLISDSSPSSSSSTLSLTLTLSSFLSTTITTSSFPSSSLIDVFASRRYSPLRLSLLDFHHCLNSINQNRNPMSSSSSTTTTTVTIQPLLLLTTHLRPWRLLLSLSSLSDCSPMVESGLADQIKTPNPMSPPSPIISIHHHHRVATAPSIASIFPDEPPPSVTDGTNPLASPRNL